jgi:CcmD family protein
MSGSGIGWVVAANLVVWTGLFLYLLRLDRRLSQRRHRDHLEDRR